LRRFGWVGGNYASERNLLNKNFGKIGSNLVMVKAERGSSLWEMSEGDVRCFCARVGLVLLRYFRGEKIVAFSLGYEKGSF
jgi:hypothetical protein